jgi:hypothetical protein
VVRGEVLSLVGPLPLRRMGVEALCPHG